MADNVIRTISFRGTSEGLDELLGKLKDVAAAEKGIALVSDDLSKSQLSLAAQWRNTGLRLNENARTLDNYTKAIKQNDAALKQTAISAEQHGQRVTDLTLKYDKGALSIRKFSEEQTRMGQAANQAIQQAAKLADTAQKRGAELATMNSSAAVNQRLGVRDDFGVAQRAKDFEVAAKAADDLRARHAPLFAAQREYVARLTEIRTATALTDKERLAAVATTKAAFVEQVNSLRGVGTVANSTSKEMAALTKQSSRNAAEMLNMGRQFADVAVSLQAGQSILVVGLQQGAQIIDVIASSNRSMGQIASQALGWARGFATSTAGVVTGVAAISGAVIYMRSTWEDSQKEINRVLLTTGRNSGAALADINKIATSVAATTKLSVGEARELATALAGTGKIGVEQIASLTKHGADFAKMLGIDLPEANKILAASFADPAKGVDLLNEKIGGFDLNTRTAIKSLAAQFRFDEARAALSAGLIPTLKQVGEVTTTLGAIWDGTAKLMKDLWAGLNAAVDSLAGKSGTVAERLSKAQAEVAAIQDRINQRSGRAPTAIDRELAREFELATKRATELKGVLDSMSAKGISEVRDRVIELTNALDPGAAKLQALREQVAGLTRAMSDPGVIAGMDAEQFERASRVRDSLQQQLKIIEQQRNAYQGVSGEVSQILVQMDKQLQMAQAVGVTAQMQVQYWQTINSEREKGRTMEEAIAIAEKQRAIVVAQIASEHEKTMVSLEGQLSVAQAITGAAQIQAQATATYNNLLLQGLNHLQASEQAVMQMEIAFAQVNTSAEQQLKSLQQQGQLINASSDAERDRIKSAQTYNNLLDQGVSAMLAQKIASQELSNAEDERSRREEEAHDRAIANIRTRTDAWNAYKEGLISWSEANDEAGKATRRLADAAEDANYWINQMSSSMFSAGQAALIAELKFVPFATTWASLGPSGLGTGDSQFRSNQGGISQFNPAGYTSTIGSPFGEQTQAEMDQAIKGMFDTYVGSALTSGGVEGAIAAALQHSSFGMQDYAASTVQQLTNLLPEEKKAGSLQQQIAVLQQRPATMANMELMKQLNDQLASLTKATEDNTSATSTMTDVLSPFYSSDPRRTHLGFRAFAGGGIMTQYGELPLKQYQGGGIATSPQVAVFGEGSTPEAYVPAPAGRIPVKIEQPANSNQRPINVTINVMGNADANTVAGLKTTAFQQAQAMRRAAV